MVDLPISWQIQQSQCSILNNHKTLNLREISPCENPNSRGELQYEQTTSKTEPSIESKSAERKAKASFRTSIWSLKTVWWNLKFQTFTSRLNIELFSETFQPIC